MTPNTSNCCAICVTYHPELQVLHDLVCATIAQVDRIYLIDNSVENEVQDYFSGIDTVTTVELEKNVGVAAGLNVGIKLARSAGYGYALLLDQDSIPPSGMIERYLHAMDELSAAHIPVAALGPRYKNATTEHVSRFVRFEWFHNIYCGSDDGPRLVSADFLISSGSFLHLNVFDVVGMFNEGFFIDHVDTEWCNRAARAGYSFYGVWDVVMEHSLGESYLRLWLIRWRLQPIHRPFRLYFIIRNSILMYRDPNVRIKWMSGDIFRLLRLLALYMFFLPPRIQHMKWLAAGLIDGIRGITGGGRVFCREKKQG